MRRRSSAFTSLSFACNLLRIVCRSTVNRPFRFFPQMCVKPRKLNVSGFPSPARSPVLGRERPELDQPRLLGVQLQAELREPLAQLRQEPLGLRSVLESHDEVVREPHDDHVAARLLLPPPLDPEVEHVVQVDVRQERR